MEVEGIQVVEEEKEEWEPKNYNENYRKFQSHGRREEIKDDEGYFSITRAKRPTFFYNLPKKTVNQ